MLHYIHKRLTKIIFHLSPAIPIATVDGYNTCTKSRIVELNSNILLLSKR